MGNNCLICEKKNSLSKVYFYKRFEIDVDYCKSCNLYQVIGKDDEIKTKYLEYYKGEFWHSQRPKGSNYFEFKRGLTNFLVRNSRKFNVSPLMAISQYNLFKKYLKGNSVLEIGAGHGDTLRFFKSKRFKVSGIEPDPIQCKKINHFFKKNICKSIDVEVEKIEGKYDLVYMSHVFEHFVNPLTFLNKIKSNLNPEGIIFIEVPNCENKLMRKISLEAELHTFHFTKKSIDLLFEKAGYEVLFSGVYDDNSNSIIGRGFKSIFHINNYIKFKNTSGKKLLLAAKLKK